MQKVFHFDSPRGLYVCDAAVVWCFDNRFEQAFRKFMQRSGIVYADTIKVAGGAKCLASPARETEREFVLEQIRTSIRLHKTERVMLLTHSDCGAYGGLEGRFKGDARAEALFHKEELRRAGEELEKAIPGIEIQRYFADFEGIWKLG